VGGLQAAGRGGREAVGDEYGGLGRALLLAGGALALLACSSWGQPPVVVRPSAGDIHLQSERLSCFFSPWPRPAVSLILTVLLNVLLRLFRH
jgi:hypothetical protein